MRTISNNPTGMRKMNNETEMQELEETVRLTEEYAKEFGDLSDALERLEKNPDFKKVILEGYFEKNASRLVLLRADGNIRANPEAKESIDDQLIAIGELRQYFIAVKTRGYQAKEALKEADKMMEEAIA